MCRERFQLAQKHKDKRPNATCFQTGEQEPRAFQANYLFLVSYFSFRCTSAQYGAQVFNLRPASAGPATHPGASEMHHPAHPRRQRERPSGRRLFSNRARRSTARRARQSPFPAGRPTGRRFTTHKNQLSKNQTQKHHPARNHRFRVTQLRIIICTNGKVWFYHLNFMEKV